MNQPNQEQTSKYSSDAEILSGVALTRPTVCKGLTKGWENVPLSSIVRIIRGVTYSKTDSSAEQNHGNLPVLRANNIQNGRLIFEDLVYVPDSKISDQQKIKQGDIVLAMSSGSRSVVGKAARATNDWMGGFGAFCGLLRPSELIEERYVNWFTSSSEYRNKVSELAAGVNINNLKPSHFDEIFIPFASLAEQQQIAAKLDELLAQVDIIKTRLDTIPKILKRFRQSVLAAAVSGKLTEEWRKSHDLELWKKIKLEDVANILDPHPSHRTPKAVECGIPYIGIGDLKDDGSIDFERARKVSSDILSEHQNRYQLKQGDFVFGKIGTLGKATMLPVGVDYTLSANVILIQPKLDMSSPMYLMFFLSSPKTMMEVAKQANSTSQAAFGIKKMRAFHCEIPSIEEQIEIVTRVEQLFTYADQIEQRVKDAQAKVNHLTQSILAKAFRGELTADWRTQNPDLISGENSAVALIAKIKAERETLATTKKTGKKVKA